MNGRSVEFFGVENLNSKMQWYLNFNLVATNTRISQHSYFLFNIQQKKGEEKKNHRNAHES